MRMHTSFGRITDGKVETLPTSLGDWWTYKVCPCLVRHAVVVIGAHVVGIPWVARISALSGIVLHWLTQPKCAV